MILLSRITPPQSRRRWRWRCTVCGASQACLRKESARERGETHEMEAHEEESELEVKRG